MGNWNGLDFFIFLIFFVNTMYGMSRGAMKEIISMMCLSVALIFTIRFTVPLANFIDTSPSINNVITATPVKNFMAAIGADPLTADFLAQLAYALSVLICFVGAFSVSEAVLVSSFSEMFTFPYALWNRKVGAALGATRGYVISVIFIMIIGLHIFVHDNRRTYDEFARGSYFIGLFEGAAMRLDQIILGQEVTRYQEIYRDKNLFNEKSIQQILQPSGGDLSGSSVGMPSSQPKTQPSSQQNQNNGIGVMDQLQRAAQQQQGQ